MRLVLAVAAIAAVVLALWWLREKPRRSASETRRVEATVPEAKETPIIASGIVFGVDGEPLAGATVELRESSQDDQTCSICGQPLFVCDDPSVITEVLRSVSRAHPSRVIESTTTDATGAFSFSKATRGEVWAFKAKAGRATGELGELPLSLFLSPEQDAVAIVKDEDQQAISGAYVAVVDETTLELKELSTDKNGQVPMIVRGPIWIAVRAQGYVSTISHGPFMDGEAQITLFRPRTLIVQTRTAGLPVDADIEVSNMRWHPRKMRTLGGSVVLTGLDADIQKIDATGDELRAPSVDVELVESETTATIDLRAAARLQVRLKSSTGEPVPNANLVLNGSAATQEATSGEDGSVPVIGPVPEGSYDLSVSATGSANVLVPVDLKPGENTLEIVVRPLAVICGRVVARSGEPVDGAAITATSVLSGSEITVGTDHDGRFELLADEPGPYWLDAWFKELGTAKQEVVAPVDSVELMLEPRARLVVHVEGPDGPLAWAYVVVRIKQRNVAQEQTDENGNVEIIGLEPGLVSVVVSAADLRLWTQNSLSLAADQSTALNVTLDTGVSLSGVVVGANGEAIPDASLFGSDLNASTDENGKFELQHLDPDRDYAGVVQAEHYEPLEVHLTSGSSDVRVVLVPSQKNDGPHEYKGSVVDEAGQLVAGANVSCDECATSVETGSDGQFTITADAAVSELQAARGEARGSGATTGSIRVMLRKPTRVTGVLLGPGRTPASGSIVAERQNTFSIRVDAGGDGRFTLDLAAGEWRFTTRFRAGSERITVAGDHMEITLGAPKESCDLALLAPVSARNVSLMIPGDALALPVQLVAPRAANEAWRAFSVECGSYAAVIEHENGSFTRDVVLQGPLTQVWVLE